VDWLDIVVGFDFLSDWLGRMIEISQGTRRIVTLELTEKLVLEIKDRLLPLRLIYSIGRNSRFKADDTSKFSQRIIVGKHIVFTARVIRKSFISHAHPTQKTQTLQCQRIVGKW
jgi:hypothetical protein